jgi:hypothetical protein
MCWFLLVALFRREGLSFVDRLRFERATWKPDLLLAIGLFLLAGPISYLPNVAVATALWGSPQASLDLFYRPLPLWAATVSLVAFPLSVALTELPWYFAYALPRLEARTGSRPLAVILASLALALQHVTLPLLFDGRFFTWRLLMFIPFALFVGLIVGWRPRLLPYLMVGHFLVDIAAAAMLLPYAY